MIRLNLFVRKIRLLHPGLVELLLRGVTTHKADLGERILPAWDNFGSLAQVVTPFGP